MGPMNIGQIELTRPPRSQPSMKFLTVKWKIIASCILALLGPLPLPHVDTYLPAALGLFFSALALGRDGPTYFLLMVAVLVVYGGVSYMVLSHIARWLRRRKGHNSA